MLWKAFTLTYHDDAQRRLAEIELAVAPSQQPEVDALALKLQALEESAAQLKAANTALLAEIEVLWQYHHSRARLPLCAPPRVPTRYASRPKYCILSVRITTPSGDYSTNILQSRVCTCAKRIGAAAREAL